MTPGEWIDWPGGDCPLPPETAVDVRFRRDEDVTGTPAGYWDWEHAAASGTGMHEDYDIIAYRVRGVAQ